MAFTVTVEDKVAIFVLAQTEWSTILLYLFNFVHCMIPHPHQVILICVWDHIRKLESSKDFPFEVCWHSAILVLSSIKFSQNFFGVLTLAKADKKPFQKEGVFWHFENFHNNNLSASLKDFALWSFKRAPTLDVLVLSVRQKTECI